LIKTNFNILDDFSAFKIFLEGVEKFKKSINVFSSPEISSNLVSSSAIT